MKIKLADYRKIASQIEKRKIEVSEKEIDETLAWLQKSRAKFALKNAPCQKGDWVEIEYHSPQIEGGLKIKDSFILGRGNFFRPFEENLEEMEAGAEKEFQLIFPDNHYQKNLAGKRINFQVKVVSVQKVEFPEIDDQFAQNLGNFQNLEVLKKNLKEGIKLEKEQQESQRIRQVILEKIAQNTEIEVLQALVEKEKKRMLEDLKKRIPKLFQISFEDYLVKINKTEEEIEESFSDQARKRIKNFLILKEIGQREKIEVSEKEIEEGVNRILREYPNLANELDAEKLKGYAKEVIKIEKVFQLLESLTKKS